MQLNSVRSEKEPRKVSKPAGKTSVRVSDVIKVVKMKVVLLLLCYVLALKTRIILGDIQIFINDNDDIKRRFRVSAEVGVGIPSNEEGVLIPDSICNLWKLLPVGAGPCLNQQSANDIPANNILPILDSPPIVSLIPNASNVKYVRQPLIGLRSPHPSPQAYRYANPDLNIEPSFFGWARSPPPVPIHIYDTRRSPQPQSRSSPPAYVPLNGRSPQTLFPEDLYYSSLTGRSPQPQPDFIPYTPRRESSLIGRSAQPNPDPNPDPDPNPSPDADADADADASIDLDADLDPDPSSDSANSRSPSPYPNPNPGASGASRSPSPYPNPNPGPPGASRSPSPYPNPNPGPPGASRSPSPYPNPNPGPPGASRSPSPYPNPNPGPPGASRSPSPYPNPNPGPPGASRSPSPYPNPNPGPPGASRSPSPYPNPSPGASGISRSPSSFDSNSYYPYSINSGSSAQNENIHI